MSATTTDEALLPPAPPPRAGKANTTLANKLVLLVILLGVLMVPIWLIGELVGEREARQEEVRSEIARGWGQAQAVLGPVLVIPYRTPVASGNDPNAITHWAPGVLTVLPTALQARIEIDPEARKRGLFAAVVYRAHVAFSGSFSLPSPVLPEQPNAELLWHQAYLVQGASDLRQAANQSTMNWEGRALGLNTTAEDSPLCLPGETMRFPLQLDQAPETGRSLAFTASMELRGTQGIRLVPTARQTQLAVTAPWPTPSFTGAELPESQAVTEQGFEAAWTTGTRQSLLRRANERCTSGHWAAASGVDLLEAVPTYRMVNRTAKYALLFLALAFLTYFLFEVTARQRIHLVQYGLLGLSVVLFPLLLLALGEPLGFATAYLLATAAVMLQASAYTASVTRRYRLAGIFAAVLAALFGFLYIVLSLESFALLSGTVALFAALSIVMVATRRVNWGGDPKIATELSP